MKRITVFTACMMIYCASTFRIYFRVIFETFFTI